MYTSAERCKKKICFLGREKLNKISKGYKMKNTMI